MSGFDIPEGACACAGAPDIAVQAMASANAAMRVMVFMTALIPRFGERSC
jgi:hypothetical protein